MKKLVLILTCLCGLFLAQVHAAHAATQYSGVININTATLEQIETLPGIGPKKAQAILDLRGKKAFVKIEDLLLVDGIGEALFAKLKPYLVLEGQTTLKATEVSN